MHEQDELEVCVNGQEEEPAPEEMTVEENMQEKLETCVHGPAAPAELSEINPPLTFPLGCSKMALQGGDQSLYRVLPLSSPQQPGSPAAP